MKLVLFTDGDRKDLRPGVLVNSGVVDASAIVPPQQTPQLAIEHIINNFSALKPILEQETWRGRVIPMEQVRLGPPLPKPGKLVCAGANYKEHADIASVPPLFLFLKNPDAVIGPGDVIELPDHPEPYAFMHEAELALVVKGPAKRVSKDNWRSAIFGYTAMIDVTARGEGRRTWRMGGMLGKSFDTFAPLGPCIVTADEIPDPNNMHVRFWNDGQLRHDYNTDDMLYRVPELIEFITHVMTLHSGDVIATGTNHEGLGFLQDGETVNIAIEGIGDMTLTVKDPLKRTWERGVYMGHDSTNHEAIRKNKEAGTHTALAIDPGKMSIQDLTR